MLKLVIFLLYTLFCCCLTDNVMLYRFNFFDNHSSSCYCWELSVCLDTSFSFPFFPCCHVVFMLSPIRLADGHKARALPVNR